MKERRHITKGQIMIAVITVTGGLFDSIISAWSVVGSKTAEIDKTVSNVKITEELHYKELKENLESIEGKLDKFLEIKTVSKK